MDTVLASLSVALVLGAGLEPATSLLTLMRSTEPLATVRDSAACDH